MEAADFLIASGQISSLRPFSVRLCHTWTEQLPVSDGSWNHMGCTWGLRISENPAPCLHACPQRWGVLQAQKLPERHSSLNFSFEPKTMGQSQHDINNKIKHHVHAANRTAKAGRLDRHSGDISHVLNPSYEGPWPTLYHAYLIDLRFFLIMDRVCYHICPLDTIAIGSGPR
jgi:hypothetical protein